MLAIRYSDSIQSGTADENLRWLAIGTFTLAAASDGVDGFVARHFNQHSALGAFLDPIADKFLLLTGIITFSLTPWGTNNWHIPVWFATIVIVRDIIILGGITILYYLKRHIPIQPSWIGKICTATQMILLIWVMLQITSFPIIYPTIIAAIFTIWSGIYYVRQGFQIHFNAQK